MHRTDVARQFHGVALSLYFVMPGLVPGIHVFRCLLQELDGRNKSRPDGMLKAPAIKRFFAARQDKACGIPRPDWNTMRNARYRCILRQRRQCPLRPESDR
jgi:hypothetical protein